MWGNVFHHHRKRETPYDDRDTQSDSYVKTERIEGSNHMTRKARGHQVTKEAKKSP